MQQLVSKTKGMNLNRAGRNGMMNPRQLQQLMNPQMLQQMGGAAGLQRMMREMGGAGNMFG